MKILISSFRKSLLLVLVLSIAYSCSDDDTSNEEVNLTQTELKAVLETYDITAGIDIALYDLYNNTGNSGKALSNE